MQPEVPAGGRRELANRMIVAYLVLAGPVVATVLFWGSWGWLAATVVVAVVEYATPEALATVLGLLFGASVP